MAAILNQIELKKKLDGIMQSRQMIGLAKSAANTRFVFAKQDLMEELDSNEVIREIKDACANPAITSSEIISKGNIASVIGFYKDSHPEEDLKKVLKEEIQMNTEPKIEITNNKVKYSFKVSLPSKASLDEKLPAPQLWIGRSWVRIIEEGISASLKRYIFWSAGFKKSNSRSTTGLQLSEKQGIASNQAVFTPKKFLTNILENFINKFK